MKLIFEINESDILNSVEYNGDVRQYVLYKSKHSEYITKDSISRILKTNGLFFWYSKESKYIVIDMDYDFDDDEDSEIDIDYRYMYNKVKPFIRDLKLKNLGI